jgi:hypothetical protein
MSDMNSRRCKRRDGHRGHPRYYSINLSARKERSGTSTPIALAVLRLIASSDFVGGLIVVKHVTVNAD